MKNKRKIRHISIKIELWNWKRHSLPTDYMGAVSYNDGIIILFC